MIFLDANILLRALTHSSDPAVQRMNQQAGDLLRRADRGEVEVTTSDAVIAEVAFILTSRAHYQLSVADTAGRVATVLRARGLRIRDKRAVLGAFDLWVTNPKLGFVDALTVSYAQHADVELATFDTDFDQIRGITRWQPEDDARNGF
jgi:predicted nucleic acid-binding protein